MSDAELITSAIRSIPDYPKPGILFRDVTTLLGNAAAFRATIDGLTKHARTLSPQKIAGLEARGFILGGAVAHALGLGFVPIRKKGKLPAQVHRQQYALEYGFDELEVHVDAVTPGERVLIIDDLIATGGTAAAAHALLQRVSATTVGAAFVIDLPDLGGAQKLAALGLNVHSLVAFPGH
ncbi:MAG: adenine phosphoribosyltransferase [Archangium sp.]